MNAPNKPIRLQPNRQKLVEVILYLIGAGVRSGSPLTQYQIVKSIFLADVAHLNHYGRPITFDNYAALEFGPVPSEAYEMLKAEYPWRQVGLRAAPWAREQVSQRAFHYVAPERDPDLRKLSKSDVSALDEAMQHVREIGFGAIKDETHDHRAWKEAWGRRGSLRGSPMNYGLLLEHEDPDLVADLAYASARQA